MTEMITVGGFTEPIEKAMRLVREYVTEYGKWSYPAYDGYLRDKPTKHVEQQDLLAAALLNAGQQPIPTYYGLLRILPEINRRLEDPRLTGTLEEASDDTLDAISVLYGILDDSPSIRSSSSSSVRSYTGSVRSCSRCTTGTSGAATASSGILSG